MIITDNLFRSGDFNSERTLRREFWCDSVYSFFMKWFHGNLHGIVFQEQLVYSFSYEYISVSAPVPLQNGISLYDFQQITRSDMFQEEALVRDPTDSFTSRS